MNWPETCLSPLARSRSLVGDGFGQHGVEESTLFRKLGCEKVASAGPLLAATQPLHPARGTHNPKPIDAHYHALEVAMKGVFHELGLAA